MTAKIGYTYAATIATLIAAVALTIVCFRRLEWDTALAAAASEWSILFVAVRAFGFDKED